MRDLVVDGLRRLAADHGLTPTANALELEANVQIATAAAYKLDPVQVVRHMRTGPPDDRTEATIKRLSPDGQDKGR